MLVMQLLRFLRFRYLILLLLALIVGAGVYGFAASNTVPVSGAGDTASDITGYDISAISYVLHPGDPSIVDGVTFTVTAQDPEELQPSNVKVMVATAIDWTTCVFGTGTGPWTYSCTLTTAVDTADASSLRVVAAQ